MRVSAASEPQTNFADAALALDLRIALFTIADSTLYVALQDRADGLSLPRGLPRTRESLDAAARRTVRAADALAGAISRTALYLQSSGRWRASRDHCQLFALICSGAAPDASEGMIGLAVPISVDLSESDAIVIDYALVRLRAKLGYTNIAFSLLPETFTLTELQTAYESILGRRLDKRNFRRRTIASGIRWKRDETARRQPPARHALPLPIRTGSCHVPHSQLVRRRIDPGSKLIPTARRFLLTGKKIGLVAAQSKNEAETLGDEIGGWLEDQAAMSRLKMNSRRRSCRRSTPSSCSAATV